MFSTTDKLYNAAQPLKNDTVKSAHVYRKEAHNMLSKKLLSDIYNMIPFIIYSFIKNNRKWANN